MNQYTQREELPSLPKEVWEYLEEFYKEVQRLNEVSEAKQAGQISETDKAGEGKSEGRLANN